jgi:hypothetical protein
MICIIGDVGEPVVPPWAAWAKFWEGTTGVLPGRLGKILGGAPPLVPWLSQRCPARPPRGNSGSPSKGVLPGLLEEILGAPPKVSYQAS